MFGITHFEFFVVAVFLLNVTPGPDTAYIVGRSVAQGRGAGLMSALGISAGCCVHSLACAFGLTALLAASATAFTVIKFVGAIYLIYLGVRLVFAKPAADQAVGEARGAGAPKSLRQLFLQGFWTNVLNPKVVLFFVSFFPQFVTTGSDHKALAFLMLGVVFVVMSMIWNSFVAWIAGSVTRRFSGKPSV
ncbi:MAG: LysE family translocator, partial [Paraburkholderia fungorum]|nr:LysE family translocator [Paraburkholderia fungorum]